MIRPEFLAVLLVAAPVIAAPRHRTLVIPPQPAVVNAVADVFRPFPPDQQKLGGVIGARLRANSGGYIERILETQQKDPQAGVSSAQTGELLEAAAYTFAYNRDARVNTVMDGLGKKLLVAQTAEGYFGTRSNPNLWTEQDTSIQAAGILGLLNYYLATGYQPALSAASKAADLLVKERRKQSSQQATVFALAIEPMVDLFRYTDDNRYLQFSNAVAEAWLHNRSPELPVTDKNLAVLNGLVELYRVNGDNSVFAAPLRAWTEMHASGFALTGVPLDISGSPDALNACTTAAWLQLSVNLLRISGQAVYSEQVERTVYNQLFAAQDLRTGAVLAPVSWSGKKEPANTNACAASEVRALSQLPSMVWGRYGNGIAVNLYTPGRSTVHLRRRGTIQLYVETNYPESGSVLLHVEPDHPIHFPLRLRVPDWTSNFTADIHQVHVTGKPGDFLTINRAWKRGDAVKISIDMTSRVIRGFREYSADVAIARGPQVLALGKPLNPDIGDLNAVVLDHIDSAGFELSPLPNNYTANWMGDQAYTVMGRYEGQPRRLVLIPFADATNYRVWLAQSNASSGVSSR